MAPPPSIGVVRPNPLRLAVASILGVLLVKTSAFAQPAAVQALSPGPYELRTEGAIDTFRVPLRIGTGVDYNDVQFRVSYASLGARFEQRYADAFRIGRDTARESSPALRVIVDLAKAAEQGMYTLVLEVSPGRGRVAEFLSIQVTDHRRSCPWTRPG